MFPRNIHRYDSQVRMVPRNIRTSIFEVCMFPRNIHLHDSQVRMVPRNTYTHNLEVRMFARNIHTFIFEVCMFPRNIHSSIFEVCMFPRTLGPGNILPLSQEHTYLYFRGMEHTYLYFRGMYVSLGTYIPVFSRYVSFLGYIHTYVHTSRGGGLRQWIHTTNILTSQKQGMYVTPLGFLLHESQSVPTGFPFPQSLDEDCRARKAMEQLSGVYGCRGSGSIQH